MTFPSFYHSSETFLNHLLKKFQSYRELVHGINVSKTFCAMWGGGVVKRGGAAERFNEQKWLHSAVSVTRIR